MSLKALGAITTQLNRSRQIAERTDRAIAAIRAGLVDYRIDESAEAELLQLADVVSLRFLGGPSERPEAEHELTQAIREAIASEISASKNEILSARDIGRLKVKIEMM